MPEPTDNSEPPIWIPFQAGTCQRCGKEVTRRSPDQRWHDQFGRDRCRASWEDDQCLVIDVRDEEWPAKLVKIEVTTVTLIAADGTVLLEQVLMPGVDWQEDLSHALPVASISVHRTPSEYYAPYTPGVDERRPRR